jgi:hypothetical protein
MQTILQDSLTVSTPSTILFYLSFIADKLDILPESGIATIPWLQKIGDAKKTPASLKDWGDLKLNSILSKLLQS